MSPGFPLSWSQKFINFYPANSYTEIITSEICYALHIGSRHLLFTLQKWNSHYCLFFFLLVVAERAVNPSVRTGFNMQIATSNSYTLCGDISGVAANRTTIITCAWPAMAKYVSFHLNEPSKTYLNFYEIEIHGIR